MEDREQSSGGSAVPYVIQQERIGVLGEKAQPSDLDGYAKVMCTDVALEMRGKRLWFFSVKVRP